MLDHVPFMICRCDDRGRYLYANRAYVVRFDHSASALLEHLALVEAAAPARRSATARWR